MGQYPTLLYGAAVLEVWWHPILNCSLLTIFFSTIDFVSPANSTLTTKVNDEVQWFVSSTYADFPHSVSWNLFGSSDTMGQKSKQTTPPCRVDSWMTMEFPTDYSTTSSRQDQMQPDIPSAFQRLLPEPCSSPALSSQSIWSWVQWKRVCHATLHEDDSDGQPRGPSQSFLPPSSSKSLCHDVSWKERCKQKLPPSLSLLCTLSLRSSCLFLSSPFFPHCTEAFGSCPIKLLSRVTHHIT